MGNEFTELPLEYFEQLLGFIERDKVEKRLKDKFIWLDKYQLDIFVMGNDDQMTRTLEKQLKVLGLNQESITQFSENISHLIIPTSLQTFYQRILNYLKGEMEKIQDDRTILATSDVLESIFGKYKRFSQRCPLKDFRPTLLTIPLSTMNLTSNVIKKALETVRCCDPAFLTKSRSLKLKARSDLGLRGAIALKEKKDSLW